MLQKQVARRCVAFVVYNAAAPGAVMDITRRQAAFLAERGINVVVFSNKLSKNWTGVQFEHVDTYDNRLWRLLAYGVNGVGRRLPIGCQLNDLRAFLPRYRFGFAAANRLVSRSKKQRIDGVLINQHFVAIGLSKTRTTKNKALILVSHGDIFEHPKNAFGPFVTKMYRHSAVLAYQKARYCIVVGSSLRKRALQCGAREESVSIIPSGISMDEISGASHPNAGRRIAQIEMLSVGRLSKEKNVATLLKAVAKAGLPSYRVRIAGDGPEKRNLLRLTAELHISGHVEFMGMVERKALASLYTSSDLFVLPSLTEAQGRVLLEAMLCELPVIATDVGAVSDTVDDEKTGVLVAAGDVDAMALAIRRLAADEAFRRKLGVAGKHKAMQCDWPNILDRFYGVVTQVTEENNAESTKE